MAEGVLDTHRRIGPPTGIGRPPRHKEAGDQQGTKNGHQPKGHGIQPRERHVWGTNHGGDQQVVEPIQHWKDEQEQHDRSVHRVNAVVHGAIHQIGLRSDQFTPDDHGEQATDQKIEKSQHDILNTNHLGIGIKREIAPPGAFFWVGVIRRKAGRSHGDQASWGRVLDPGTLT